MSQALYRKYRSRSLDEVVGQEHITSLLRRAISRGSVSHAYLLTGPKGVGKTSIARIIAHEINDLPYSDESQHLDIIEIDAASNNGVEDVRDLRDKVHIAPSSATKKVYIIDEVHMLSKQAFNALLKTLEEPPEHVVFILATTDADKLPPTIISRVQRFNFRAITIEDAKRHLTSIAKKESIDITDDALELIARHGGGSFRDSIGLLDQLRHAGEGTIELDDVQLALGITSQDTVQSLIDAYRSGNLADISSQIRRLEDSGTQASIVARQLIELLQSEIISHPEDIDTLDALLEVGSSPYPYIKLLSVLAINAKVPTNAAQSSSEHRHTVTPPKNPSNSTDNKKKSKEEVDVAQSSNTQSASNTAAKQHTPITTSTLAELNWQDLLDALKSEVALSSLLAKCSHIETDGTLIIFAGNKFNASKINGPKQLPKLHAALEELGYTDVTIDIQPEKAPPRDSHLARIADIMGGGEEVEFNG